MKTLRDCIGVGTNFSAFAVENLVPHRKLCSTKGTFARRNDVQSHNFSMPHCVKVTKGTTQWTVSLTIHYSCLTDCRKVQRGSKIEQFIFGNTCYRLPFI